MFDGCRKQWDAPRTETVRGGFVTWTDDDFRQIVQRRGRDEKIWAVMVVGGRAKRRGEM